MSHIINTVMLYHYIYETSEKTREKIHETDDGENVNYSRILVMWRIQVGVTHQKMAPHASKLVCTLFRFHLNGTYHASDTEFTCGKWQFVNT